jgi:superfamily II DNA or RNA helicase
VIPVSDVLTLEQRANRCIVYCPNQSAVDAVTSFLTFKRPLAERTLGQVQWKTVDEPCYHRTNLWNAVECPMGFWHSLISTFRRRYDINLLEKRPRRIEENCIPDWSRLAPNLQFRVNQREILEAMFAADRGRVIVPTAVGKSFLITQYITLLPKARIIVTTSAQSVLIQLWEDINKVLLGKAGIECSAKKFNPGARVVCVSTGTLKKYVSFSGEQDIDVVLADEVHELGSKLRIELFEHIREAKMFGFSANATRPDKAEFRINGVFGPVLAAMRYEDAVDKNLVTPICVIWCPVRSHVDPTSHYETYAAKEKYGIWRYYPRNQAIAEAAKIFGAEEQVLITVKTIDHALHLHKLLPDYRVVYSPKDYRELNRFRYLQGVDKIPMLTKETLASLKKQFEKGCVKKVIATSVWSRGVNFPDLSVLIRADASNSCIADTQWPGRASRKREGKEVSLVFDFTDEYCFQFHQKALARGRRYKEYGWEQMSLQQLKDNI